MMLHSCESGCPTIGCAGCREVYGLTFRHLRQENVARCPEFGHTVDDYSPSDWQSKLSEEVGEVAKICNKIRKGEATVDSAREEMAKELGDVVAYCDLMAARFGIDLGDATRRKFNEVSDRIDSMRKL